MSVRTTISLPDDLKARMDAVDEQVNWSSEAAKCFERLLGNLAARKQEKDLSDVIARLRATKHDDEEKDSRIAHEAGVRWATHHATFAELERAARYELMGGQWLAPWRGADYVAFDILGLDADNLSREDLSSESEEFWAAALGSENTGWVNQVIEEGEDDFLSAFLEGASEIWEKVADKV